MTTHRLLVLACLLLFLGGGTVARAQDEEEKELGWADEAELALVVTAGNSRTSTFGFRNLLTHTWEKALLGIEAKALRTETTSVTRTPVGSSIDDFRVEEESVSELTAENYLLRGKYDRDISARVFLFGSGGWTRNEFAGIRNRTTAAFGLGNIWFDREGSKWRTDYGVSYTREEGTVAEVRNFAGLRLSTDFSRALGANTTFANLTIADANLDETSDFRLDMLTSLAVGMSDHLALKVSLQFLFDNDPALVEAQLEFPRGVATGIQVPVPADKLDTLFNVALVIDF